MRGSVVGWAGEGGGGGKGKVGGDVEEREIRGNELFRMKGGREIKNGKCGKGGGGKGRGETWEMREYGEGHGEVGE